LTYVDIRNGVDSIGYYTFGDCTFLTNVDVASSVASVGEFAFYGSFNLKSILFKGNAPGADFTVFMDDNQTTVYYLSGTQGWGSTFGEAPTALW